MGSCTCGLPVISHTLAPVVLVRVSPQTVLAVDYRYHLWSVNSNMGSPLGLHDTVKTF